MMNTANRAQRATDRNRDNELNANGSGCLVGVSQERGSAALKADKGRLDMSERQENIMLVLALVTFVGPILLCVAALFFS